MALDEDRSAGHRDGRRPDGPTFEVAPVTQRSRLPRTVLVAGAAALLAFVGGLAVASPAPVDRSATLAARSTTSAARSTASTAGSPAPTTPEGGDLAGTSESVGTSEPVGASEPVGTSEPVGPAASPAGPDARAVTPTSGATAGGSAFLAALDPSAILRAAPHGARCEVGEARQKEVPRTRRDGPRITVQRSWLAWCPVAARDRQAFLLGVLDGLEQVVPADTFGYSATRAGGGDALFPYAEPPLAGTVAVTADDAGTGYGIAIVVQEWRVDPGR